MSHRYHYTCEDGADGIRKHGAVMPMPQPILGGVSLVWLTDLPTPDMFGLGLTSAVLTCDRTAYRITVADGGEVTPWGAWAHMRRVPRALRDALEDGAAPAHWYVSERAVTVLDVAESAHVAKGAA